MSHNLSKILILLTLVLHVCFPVYAEDAAGEPDVNIRYGEDKTFYEYRVKGELVQIKVVPEVGPEYYLVPSETGEWVREEQAKILVPSWKVIEW